jgi:hypothetical protein
MIKKLNETNPSLGRFSDENRVPRMLALSILNRLNA